MRLLLLLALTASLSCGPKKGEPKPATEATPTEATGPIGFGKELICEQMTRSQCMVSDRCQLTKPDGLAADEYRCRPKLDDCEKAFVQADFLGAKAADVRMACRMKEGCNVTGDSCYCACRDHGKTLSGPDDGPQCDCECTGGVPPACVAE